LRQGSGSHFEGRMVEALISYYSKTYLEKRPGRFPLDGERRRTRVPYRAPVFFRVNGRTSSATCEDISASGIFVASDHDMNEGAALELSIAFPDNPAAIVEAKGRVAWVNNKRARTKPDFPAGFGVELLEFREATGEIFKAFMSSYAPAA